MKCEWKTVKLGDVADFNKLLYSAKDGWKFVNYLDTGNITKNRIEAIQYIDLLTESLPSRAKRKVENSNIIYSSVRPNQLHYGYIKTQPNNFLVSTGFVVIDVDEKIADSKFIYYFLTQNNITNYLHSIAEQSVSAYPSIKSSDLADVEINLSDLGTQKKIAKILSALDDKIECNNQINKNLEEQAREIFKNWITSCDIRVNIGELCNNILDYSENQNQFVRLLNSSDVTEGIFPNIPFTENTNLKGHFKKRFKYGDILYSEIRPRNHHYGYVLFDTKDYIASTRLMVIRNKPEFISSVLLYQYLLLPEVESEFTLKTESRSGTFPQGNYADLAAIVVPYGNLNMQSQIEPLLMGMRKTIYNNQIQNIELATLRDTLLPKLMSGELDVDKIEL